MPKPLRAGDPSGGFGRLGVRRIVLVVALLTVCTLLACGGGWTPPEPTGYRRTEPVPGAGQRIGEAACAECHASYEGHSVSSAYHADCESCHGPGQRHAYTARPSDIQHPDNKRCESCHQVGSKTLLGWTSSRHARSGVLCSDCHNPHNRELSHVRAVGELESSMLPAAGHNTRMCGSCHSEVVAQLNLPSHHPVREGMIECTDCHTPHETRRTALGAQTDACTSCHQEVAGPWIYEHAPVSEDCGFCHAPHGASADFLLEVPQPATCLSCHTIPISGAVHTPWAFTTRCTDCHNAIHGSFTDPILRR